jgi:hypothetical protein
VDAYNESEFRARVDAALNQIRTILDTTRNPQYPADVPHQYDDKYTLTEFLTRTTVAALLQCLGNIGLSPEGLAKLKEWAKTRVVTLRLKSQESCSFVREETRKIESPHERVIEHRSSSGAKSSLTEKVVTTVTEYFWRFEFTYELVAFQGASEEQGFVTLLTRSGTTEIKTAANTTPRLRVVIRPSIDVNISWLLKHLDKESRVSFSIDRVLSSCHTPRRNVQVEEALDVLEQLTNWCVQVASYFGEELFPIQQAHGLDLTSLDDNEIFVPVVPLFEEGAANVTPLADMNIFLAEQQRSLAAKCSALAKTFPQDNSVITAVEASLMVILMHSARICQQYSDGVNSVEGMLRTQLISAIGKELTPADFTGYMDFHARKLMKPEYRPLPFSHAVRRPEHYPEGVLSLEAGRGGSMPDPISTTVAQSAAARPMSFALDASTRVSFLGERYLHAWISHQFSDASGLSLSLVARARQFSSFILLVGKISSADTFAPKFGIIVQNKDLLKIPLMLEQIPTPKEFRDAIESLSPEQQRFAKAFRSMQLESTLFGVCVIQIKPQLEKLLRLEPDSLTKEIKLTQELLSLFIEYQIPSDLLSYDGSPEAPAAEKLAKVKEYAARMQEMIELSKKKELEEAREREAFRLAEMNRTPPPQPAPMPVTRSAPPRAGAPYPSPMSAPMPGAVPMPPSAPPAMSFAPPPMPTMTSSVVAPPTTTPTTIQEPARPTARAEQPVAGTAEDGVLDYTKIPAALDKKFEQLDEDGALRPTIINPGEVWSRTSQKGLLAAPASATLYAKEQKEEKNKAFDLLDALSKSGALPVEHASLHVVIAATHCFDATLLDTVIQGNVNPIEKVERSLMIMATTIHQRPAVDLLMEDQRERFLRFSPQMGGV